MTIIELQTIIKAPIEVCFDLSRSVEVHILSTSQTNETAIAGRTSGLCQTGDTITWRARHFGIYQTLTVKIIRMDYPRYFLDQQIKGAFRGFSHHHYFSSDENSTIMRDVFEYSVPFGFIGKAFDKLVLKRYMTQLLQKRNQTIKEVAESTATNG
jgi:ligand-binding SRPBCC domain-containing protein